MTFDAFMSPRWQFACTAGLFVSFLALTVGLSSFLVILEMDWLRKKTDLFRVLYQLWSKVLFTSFWLSIPPGFLLTYQITTNWEPYSALVAPVIGPLAPIILAGYLVQIACFGLLSFRHVEFGTKLHVFATIGGAVGTLLVLACVISANSWMQHPAGYVALPNNTLQVTDWFDALISPTFAERMAHVLLASYLTTALVVAGASAWQLLKGKRGPAATVAFRMAVIVCAAAAVLQYFAGDFSGKHVRKIQPAKLAAIEGFWETARDQPFYLTAWPDEAHEMNRWAVAIPKVGSWMTAGSRETMIVGLKDFPPERRPPVMIVFWAARIMAMLGIAFIVFGLWGVWLMWRGKGPEWNARYLRTSVILGPLGLVAILAGWTVAEVGRQPYVVHGVLLTPDARSTTISSSASIVLSSAILVCAVLSGAGVVRILRLLKNDPISALPS